MTLKIRRACVLGAGVMGAQIAAHLAAAGVRTHLLDLSSDTPPKDPKQAKLVGKNVRSARAILAIDSMRQLKPSPLVSESVLQQLIPGNFDDDISVLASADWVIEAVTERLDIKKAIIKKIAQYARPDIPITTNTSGLSMAKMCEDESEYFQKRFFGTHFFNPPRYMKLVEIVPHAGVDLKMMAALSEWIAVRLGKGIVPAHDTINFIANRIGVFTLQATIKHAEELGLSLETVDALTGKLMGRAASASFRTLDVVGLDTYCHVSHNVFDYAPEDPYRDYFKPAAWLAALVKGGNLGQKSGAGCYKKTKNAKGETDILAYRPAQGTWETQAPQGFAWQAEKGRIPNTFQRLSAIIDETDAGAQLIWRILRDTMSYSALLVDQIAGGSPTAVDNAIAWGFNWEAGPFQLWQGIGYDKILDKMKKEKTKLPSWIKPGLEFYRPTPGTSAWATTGVSEEFTGSKYQKIVADPRLIPLPKTRNEQDKRLVIGNDGASLLDIGHGVAALVFHSKMNSINGQILDIVQKSIAKVDQDFGGLVIANDGDVFSAGANLKEMLEAIHRSDWQTIDSIIRTFQATTQLVKYAPFPVVACPHGLVLGGGCEFTLHAQRRLAFSESYVGLVEAGVGLLPAAGGTKELALRAYDAVSTSERGDPMPFLQRAFQLIGMGRTSSSAQEAIEMGLYSSDTQISFAKDYITGQAKGMVLEQLNRGYAAPTPRTAIKVVGDPGIQTFKMALYNMVQGRQISAYDAFVGEKIATVLCGGAIDGGQTVSEQYLLDLERIAFVELTKEAKTKDRIEYMLKNGKPLRN